MKKSLLALAVLGAFAGSAFAQASSVSIFGIIDQGVGKNIGTKDKAVQDATGSRIAFRGYEDLGSGLGAVFAMEHRFTPDTGAGPTGAGAPFWEGYSFVGLRSASLGQLTLGRHYTASFLTVQNQVDPFGGETVGNLRNNFNGFGRAVTVRVNDSLKYDLTAGGFAVSATFAERYSGGSERPWSLAGSYTAGPLWVAVGHEATTFDTGITTFGVRYKIGALTLMAALNDGEVYATAPVGSDFRAYLFGGRFDIGSGTIKAGLTQVKVNDVKTSQKFAIGYDYHLSKRTKLYVDYGRDSKVTTPVGDPEKFGYDFGVRHVF